MATEIVLHKIEVRRNGNRFGTIWLGKQGVQWMPVNGKHWGNITWKDFDYFMKKRSRELGRRWKSKKRQTS